jgi:hypothetical protein
MRYPKVLPLPSYNLEEEDQELWAVTRYLHVTVPIYKATRVPGTPRRDWHAFTHWRHGRMTIVIDAAVFDRPKRLDSILLHEYVHVVEYLNDPAYMSPADDGDDCTLLAQTMEVGLSSLVRNLKQVGKKKVAKKKKPR